MEIDDSNVTRTFAEAHAIGCQDVTLARGDVHFCEAPGIITSVIHLDNEETKQVIAVMVYRDADQGRSTGHGYICQLNPKFAREIGASLIKLADEIEPNSKH